MERQAKRIKVHPAFYAFKHIAHYLAGLAYYAKADHYTAGKL